MVCRSLLLKILRIRGLDNVSTSDNNYDYPYMEEKAKIRTVRVRIHVDAKKPPRHGTGAMIDNLLAMTKKIMHLGGDKKARK